MAAAVSMEAGGRSAVEKKPLAKEHRWFLGAGRGEETGSPLKSEEGRSPADAWVLDSWPPDLQENKRVLFQATQFVVISYSSN